MRIPSHRSSQSPEASQAPHTSHASRASWSSVSLGRAAAWALLAGSALAGCEHAVLSPEPLPGARASAALESWCRFDEPGDPARVVLAAAVGTDVLLLGADGRTRKAWSFDHAEGTNIAVQSLAARDGYIAAVAVSWTRAGSSSRVAVFDAAGHAPTLTDERLSGQPVFLGAAGQIASTTATQRGLWLAAGHDAVETPGQTPVAAPGLDAGGRVVVPVRGANQYAPPSYSWWYPADGSVRALARHSAEWDSPRWIGDRLVYLTGDAAHPALVSERPNDLLEWPLPGNTAPNDRWQVLVGDDDRWAVLASIATSQILRVDVHSGAIDVLTPRLPEGQRAFHFGREFPAFDPALQVANEARPMGELIMALRDAQVGGLFRSLDGGQGWTRIGATVSKVLAVETWGRGGTWVVTGTNGRYGGETDWPAIASDQGTLLGESVQVLRPVDGVAMTLAGAQWSEGRSLQLTRDGGCAAQLRTLPDGGARLRVIDVRRGKSFDVLSFAAGASLLTWIEPR